MLGWIKNPKIKVFCPKCTTKIILPCNKDSVYKTYKIADAWEGMNGKILAKMMCPSCKTELLIIERIERMIWDAKFTALDIRFEREVEKYYANDDQPPSEDLLQYMKETKDIDDEQIKKEILDSVNLKIKKHQEKYVQWEKETKRKLGYKV